MEERVNLIKQKRATLIQVTNELMTQIDSQNFNLFEARARLGRLGARLDAYEEMHGQLVLSKQDLPGQKMMEPLRQTFYRLSAFIDAQAQKAAARANPNVTTGGPLGNSTLIERQKQLKLPIAGLPKFSGDVELWMRFKRKFKSMIDSRTDIDDVVKFQYLQDSLEGEAAGKIDIYEPSAENYAKAWKDLTDAYERTRTLITKHLESILYLKPLTHTTYQTLNKLMDEVRQNTHMLEILNFKAHDYVIIHSVERDLPDEIRLKWEESLGKNEIPTFEKFNDFIGNTLSNMRTVEKPGSKQGAKRSADQNIQGSQTKRGKSGSRVLATTLSTCSQCQGAHLLYRCPTFEKLTLQQKWDSIKAKQLCRNCLNKHSGEFSSKIRCKKCSRFHHTLLHSDKQAPKPSSSATTSAKSDTPALYTALTSNSPSPFRSQLMMSAVVRVRDASGRFCKARMLLDTCATANFVTTDFAQKLKLPMRSHSISIGAINELHTISEHNVDIRFSSYHSNFEKGFTFLTVQKITDMTPDEVFPRGKVRIPANVRLADPEFHLPRTVDMLISSGAALSLLSIGQINLSQNGCDLYLQKTQLGWVMVGGLNENGNPTASCNLAKLAEQLARIWCIEGSTNDNNDLDSIDQCEAYYRQTTTRNVDGRYIVHLPFKEQNPELGESRTQAFRRLRSLERKFAANPELKLEYSKVMQEYIDLNHMTLLQENCSGGYYLPHHAVIKASSFTTKFRVVFDASAKSSKGLSLNDVLYVGGTTQDKLLVHLIRFRIFLYVLTADIEKIARSSYIPTIVSISAFCGNI